MALIQQKQNLSILINYMFKMKSLETSTFQRKQEGGGMKVLLDMIIEMKMAYLEHVFLVHSFMVGN